MNGTLINLQLLDSILHEQCSETQWQWFCHQRELMTIDDEQLNNNLAIALAMAKRKMGGEGLNKQLNLLNSKDTTASKYHRFISAWALSCWTRADVARVLLLASVQQNNPKNAKTVLQTAFQQGDEYEREAILKGLILLDVSGDLVNMAVDSCRTNIITLFQAIAQHNPYPAMYFDEGAFNQMVLKSLFLDINISGIVGLRSRINESMSRMCYDYLRERLAANRSFPASIWLAINLSMLPSAIQGVIKFIADDDEQQRFYIANALSWQSIPSELKAIVELRISKESNLEIRALLEKSV